MVLLLCFDLFGLIFVFFLVSFIPRFIIVFFLRESSFLCYSYSSSNERSFSFVYHPSFPFSLFLFPFFLFLDHLGSLLHGRCNCLLCCNGAAWARFARLQQLSLFRNWKHNLIGCVFGEPVPLLFASIGEPDWSHRVGKSNYDSGLLSISSSVSFLKILSFRALFTLLLLLFGRLTAFSTRTRTLNLALCTPTRDLFWKTLSFGEMYSTFFHHLVRLMSDASFCKTINLAHFFRLHGNLNVGSHHCQAHDCRCTYCGKHDGNASSGALKCVLDVTNFSGKNFFFFVWTYQRKSVVTNSTRKRVRMQTAP